MVAHAIPNFSKLHEAAMRTLVSTPPEIILHPGTPPSGLFVISDGECEVLSAHGDHHLEYLVNGDFFGEELLSGETDGQA